MSLVRKGLGKAYDALDKRRRAALHYAAMRLETTGDDARFFSDAGLARRLRHWKDRIEGAEGEGFRAFAAGRAISVALALDPADTRIDAWSQLEGGTLDPLVAGIRALAAGDPAPLLAEAVDGRALGLHPTSLLAWADVALERGKLEDAEDLMDLVLRLAPEHPAAFSLARRLREAQGRTGHVALCCEVLEMLEVERG